MIKKNKIPYFLNVHNKNNSQINSLLVEPIIPKTTKKVRKESIYSVLAFEPKFEQKQAQERIVKKNSGFLSVKRILSKTEDEKHELDIRIIQFERVNQMLGKLRGTMVEEMGGEEGVCEEIKEGKIEIEEAEAKIEEEPKPIEGVKGEKEEKVNDKKEEDKVNGEESKFEPEAIKSLEIEKNVKTESIVEEENVEKKEIMIEEKEVENLQNKQEMIKKSNEIFERHFKQIVQKHKEKLDLKLKRKEEFLSKKDQLVNKIRKLRIVDLLYDSNKRRKTKISEILFNNLHPKIVGRIQERLKEKLQILYQIRNHYSQNSWKQSLINNYYKSLDVRSGCIQQAEKTFLSPKFFISNLLETEKKIQETVKQRYWKKVLSPEISMSLEFLEKNEKQGSKKELRAGQSKGFSSDQMYDSFVKFEEDEKSNLESSPGKSTSQFNNYLVLADNKIKKGIF